MIPLRDDNPTLHRPIVTVALIVLNVIVFLWEISGPSFSERLFQFASVPYNITQDTNEDEAVLVRTFHVIGKHTVPKQEGYVLRSTVENRLPSPALKIWEQPVPPWVTLLTSMFLHGGWMHLIGNMLFLWIFGNNLEDAMGKIRFVIFYLGTGLVASAAHIFSDTASVIPTVGASGAISGVLGGYILLYPQAKVQTLIWFGYIITTMRLPAYVFLGIWFLIQLTKLGAGVGGVAWWAHIGGFIAGVALVKVLESSEHRGRGGSRRPPSGFHSGDGMNPRIY